MTKHRVTESDRERAGRQLSAPHLLNAEQELAAEAVFGAWAAREPVADHWLAVVRATPAPAPATMPTHQPTAHRPNVLWQRCKAEAKRLGYIIPSGGLSTQKRGQIAKELRALGANLD